MYYCFLFKLALSTSAYTMNDFCEIFSKFISLVKSFMEKHWPTNPLSAAQLPKGAIWPKLDSQPNLKL